jgi:hypothetical protein
MHCTMPRAAACRIGSKRRRISRRRKPRCTRCAIGSRSWAIRCEIDALEVLTAINAVATLAAPIAGVVVDRQVGPGSVFAGRRRHCRCSPSPIPRASGCWRTSAKPTPVWCSWDSRGSARARLSEPRIQGACDLCGRPRRPRHPPAAGARRNRQSRPGAEAGNVREFSHHHQRASQSPAVPEAAVVYEGDAAHVWVVVGRGLARLPRHTHRTATMD